ncbi:MAG: putative phage tail protein [Sodalis sp. (in: enterobacteria)]|uniref:putative phage tail protein n=1 Tax=Sodalis sp. (in: enterobacteria) TaxID=1898979 RepID=UPI003F3C8D22
MAVRTQLGALISEVVGVADYPSCLPPAPMCSTGGEQADRAVDTRRHHHSGENAMDSRNYAQLLSALLPPKSYALTGKRLGVELQAEGKSLAQLEICAGEVADGITPFLAVGLLVDWERMLEISPDSSMTLQQRRQQVLARINATGGLSRQYFISLAKLLGYRVIIDEPEPFRAGIGRAGERIWVPEIIWL